MLAGMNDHHHHGYKRRATEKEDKEDQEIEQPITKRLARMKIDQPLLQPGIVSPSIVLSGTSHTQWQQPPALNEGREMTNDYMHLDETPTKVYVEDLNSEIAQIEAEEEASAEKTIFPADIDKKISAIPHKLLQNKTELLSGAGTPGGSVTDTQLVLYQVPSSISAPDEQQDHVRKAILASRERAQQHHLNVEHPSPEPPDGAAVLARDSGNAEMDVVDEEMDDVDAMDLG